MRCRGFTLIELLVSIFIFAMLSMMAYRGMEAMARASDRVVSDSEYWQSVTLLFERFAADTAQPSIRAVRGADGNMLPIWWGRPLTEPGNADAQLEFTRKSPAGQDDLRLAYRLRSNTVELLTWPALDRGPSTTPTVYPLLENVLAMRFRYLDAQGVWQESWPTSATAELLPRAVKVELTLPGPSLLERIFALP